MLFQSKEFNNLYIVLNRGYIVCHEGSCEMVQ